MGTFFHGNFFPDPKLFQQQKKDPTKKNFQPKPKQIRFKNMSDQTVFLINLIGCDIKVNSPCLLLEVKNLKKRLSKVDGTRSPRPTF